MSTHTRNGFRWSVNEILSLQREFELLGWTIDQIAEKHKRTPNAIMYKLDQEGFADYNELYSELYGHNNSNISLKYNEDDEDDDSQLDDDDDDEDYVDDSHGDSDSDSENETDISNIQERLDRVEDTLSFIKGMLQQLTQKSFSSTLKDLCM